jgi:hypothetical protein
LYDFENTHHYQCIHKIICAYTSENLGQVDQNWVNCWAKIEPNWPKRAQMDRSTYFDRREPRLAHCTFLRILTTTSAYIRLFELTPVKIWVKWTKIGSIVGPNLAQKSQAGQEYLLKLRCFYLLSEIIKKVRNQINYIFKSLKILFQTFLKLHFFLIL